MSHLPAGRRAFSLVELLTVIFIISLLIAILIPSLGAARNAAKKAATSQQIKAIETGLESFKNDNGKDFPQTNGYPPSFSHPPITDDGGAVVFSKQDSAAGKFPFLENRPVVYGAHWLPAMLMGVDAQGYIPRKAVPNDRRNMPEQWYNPPAGVDAIKGRSPLYLDPNGVRLIRTMELPGRPPEDLETLFPDWDAMDELPVVADAFDQPLLYYAANTHGRESNMVGESHDPDNKYDGSAETQEKGPPYYFHQDNIGFTGLDEQKGWDFGSSGGDHPIRVPGHEATPRQIVNKPRESFAGYIIDRKIYQKHRLTGPDSKPPPNTTPLRPVNPDTYLLISPGVDGFYGTTDDITNFPDLED